MLEILPALSCSLHSHEATGPQGLNRVMRSGCFHPLPACLMFLLHVQSNERGEMQSMEVWMASDGEEIARPISQSETRQALPFPSLRPPSPVGSSRSGSADSETSAQTARRPAPKTSPLQEPAWAATGA